ncbi:hypothetical protein FHS23_002483 [Prauserella isguenensis]|uniref:Uncharacterized protein n=1 Tax=Prauserella isguenensis TaxID=1470180 RepID=A0A839S327_9PSEU|nr:hypothetical protein [Prauserella isguenensis]
MVSDAKRTTRKSATQGSVPSTDTEDHPAGANRTRIMLRK